MNSSKSAVEIGEKVKIATSFVACGRGSNCGHTPLLGIDPAGPEGRFYFKNTPPRVGCLREGETAVVEELGEGLVYLRVVTSSGETGWVRRAALVQA